MRQIILLSLILLCACNGAKRAPLSATASPTPVPSIPAPVVTTSPSPSPTATISPSPTPSASVSPTPTLAKVKITGVIRKLNTLVQAGTTPETAAGTVNKVETFLVTLNSPSSTSITSTIPKLDQICSTTTCICELSWPEVNRSTSTSVLVPRSLKLKMKQLTSYTVECEIPKQLDTELPDRTLVDMKLYKTDPDNSTGFIDITSNIPNYSFIKGEGNATGSDFSDNEGNQFDDIMRYACYEQFSRGMSIKNLVTKTTVSERGQEEVNFVQAGKFCVSKIDGSASPQTEGCTSSGRATSSQAYYYNLYTPKYLRGQINPSNSRFVCPYVKEALTNRANLTTSSVYPLDQSFALSRFPSPTFNIGVESHGNLTGRADVPSTDTPCYGEPEAATNSSGDRMVRKCIGFAKKPELDGSCNAITMTNNTTVPTFRLRRFIAIYPPLFETNGIPYKKGQSADTVYVIDRKLDNNNSVLGPKPCPFSFLDHSGSTSGPVPGYPKGVPTYVATSADDWIGKNIDGIAFPNKDVLGDNLNFGNASCSAAMPLFNEKNERWSLGTSHIKNKNPLLQKIFIRPMEPWHPHYVEDTSFQACAPHPIKPGDNGAFTSNIKDPPLHIVRTDRPLASQIQGSGSLPPKSHDYFVKILNIPGNSEIAFLTSTYGLAPFMKVTFAVPQGGLFGSYIQATILKVGKMTFEGRLLNFINYTSDTAVPPNAVLLAKDQKPQVAYCAEVYPSQNTHITGPLGIESRAVPTAGNTNTYGQVIPFTSHVIKGVKAGVGLNECAFTSPVDSNLNNYGEASSGTSCPVNNVTLSTVGNARHPNSLTADIRNAISGGIITQSPICSNKTCDRTIDKEATTQESSRIPLLARPTQIENILRSDPSFQCSMTIKNSILKDTPLKGCCGTNVLVERENPNSEREAHLEPGSGGESLCIPSKTN